MGGWRSRGDKQDFISWNGKRGGFVRTGVDGGQRETRRPQKVILGKIDPRLGSRVQLQFEQRPGFGLPGAHPESDERD